MMENVDFSRYNPEGSLLRRDQKELLRILKTIAAICDANGIQWWLDSGTLLGAARHKGFIPWDDDVDIVLLREDYLKLEKILCAMDDEEFVFHCGKTDKDYVNVFGKFRKKTGDTHVSNKRYDYYKYSGIGLDVFAIEKTNRISAVLGRFFYKTLVNYTVHIRCRALRHALISFGQALCHWAIFPLLRLVGKINPKGEYHYMIGTGWAKPAFDIETIVPVSYLSFEGVDMPAPKDADAYLKVLYGDWKKLPTEEQIRKAIHCKEYREEIFGPDDASR